MDMDFNDVFGGPPRRFSIQEMRKRHSFNDQVESEEDSPVSGLSEKPVFGTDRRRQGGEFYDDIFRGDEAYSSPRKTEPLSPAWPLPPKTEPFATSLPAQFSLPAKLTKATEYPAFGSNGSLSRFSNQRFLSREDSMNGDELPHLARSDEKDLEKEAVNQFHFSIYKWAGKGVPILTPLMRGKNSKPKENSRLERSLSSNNKEPNFVATEAIPNISEPKHLNNAKNKVVPEGPKSGSRLAEDGLRKKETESKQGNRETDQLPGEKKVMVTNTRADDSNAKFNETMKKSDTKVDKSLKKREAKVNKNVKKNDVEAKINRVDLPSKSEEKFTKVGGKGKVQEFVNIFNQEKEETQSRSSRWRGGNIDVVEKETASSTRQTNEEVQFPSMDKTSDASQSADDIFHGSFVVEELFQDQSKPLQKSDESNDVKASDAKIQQWSHGRKGNIRSLLSTLQLVLWAESGWKPVPLVDLIEGSSVKRAYQKALLCLHPDKLQQKGAASHQKYIAEKVFDILQEAWDHFNSLGGI